MHSWAQSEKANGRPWSESNTHGSRKLAVDVIEKIFRFDKKIRYCGIIDEKGDLIAGSMRKGLQSLEPESEDKKLFAQIALVVGMEWGVGQILRENEVHSHPEGKGRFLHLYTIEPQEHRSRSGVEHVRSQDEEAR